LFLGLVLVGASGAAQTTPQSRFAEGRVAFEAGDFARALSLYEEALALGQQGPAVHFNIGVSAYRSGNYPRAESAFREVARTPAMAALAHYNLGLVALAREDERAARGWFEAASRESTDERLTALAAQRLGELSARAPDTSSWSAYARGGAGYDDNVALRSSSVDSPGSGEGDSFAESLTSGSYSFRPSWRIDGAAGLLRYGSLDDFNQTALSLGVAHGIPVDAWYVELGGYATQMTLGGDVYERSVAATAQATRTFSDRQNLRAQLRLTAVDGEDDFSGISGSRTELGLRYQWGWRMLGFTAHSRAEFNDSQDDAFASRWFELGAEARWAPLPLWSFTGGTTWRRTSHPAPSSTQEGWSDRRATIRLEATRTLWKQTQLFVRYEHERNQSPVEVYDYDRNWVAASIEYWR
jgi:tetratricopeptide (TPR) repeat protein